jgi:hypothetical protein
MSVSIRWKIQLVSHIKWGCLQQNDQRAERQTVAMYGDIHTEHLIVSEGKMHSFFNVNTDGAYSYRHALED